MPIDPNIALGVKPLEVANPLNQFAQVAQLQSAQNQNALAQYQLGAAQRADQAENALSQAYQNAFDPTTGKVDRNKLRQSLATGGFGSKIPSVEKALGELETQQLTQDKARTELVDAKLKQSRAFLDGINPADPNAPAMYMQWHQANHADPVLGPMLAARGVTPEQSMARIQQAIRQGPQAFAQLLNESKLGVEKFAERNTMTAYEKAQTGLRAREVAARETEVARGGDVAFQQQLARAKEMGAAAAKGDVAALQAYPKAVAQAEQTVNLIDQMIGKRDTKGNLIKGEKVHPGFEGAVGAGLGARYIPGTEASNFEALFNQVKGGAFLQAFEALKGGGAITEKEGEKGTAALTRMSLAQSEKEFVKAATEFQDIVRAGAQRANQRVSKIGGAPAPAAPAAPTAPAAADGVKFLGFE